MKRVAVLRGGPSNEYDVSLRSGAEVLKALSQLEYPHKDIIVSKKGEWIENGFIRQPQAALEAVDIVFVAIHGAYGEDGQVQKILERKKVAFTGSRSLPSAIAFNKELTKRTLKSHGVKMPRHRKFTRDDLKNLDEELSQIFLELGNELFIKPLSNGSSLGARYIPNKEILRSIIVEILEQYDQILIEEFIRGREATVGVIDNFRNAETYTLPIIEIIPPNGDTFFSNEHKYSGATAEIVPGRFSYYEKAKMSELAQLAHNIVGCKQYSRSDFIVRDGEIYFLEINTSPGLTDKSLFPKAAAAIGLDYHQLIKHLLENATA